MVYEHLTARADLKLSASAAWLLLRLAEGSSPDGDVQPMLEELREGSLVLPGSEQLTPEGEAAAARIVAARENEIRAILAEWDCGEQPEVRALIERFARLLGSEPPPAQAAIV
jgi:hypothetical protein